MPDDDEQTWQLNAMIRIKYKKLYFWEGVAFNEAL